MSRRDNCIVQLVTFIAFVLFMAVLLGIV